MRFYTYMMRNYKTADGAKGDFARKMREDKERFPMNRPCKFAGWHDLTRDYLIRHNASEETLATFEECWAEYVAYVK